MHWLDWDRAFPRLRAWAPRVALIFRDHEPTEWSDGLREIIPRYSTNAEFIAYDLIEELAARDLFHVEGEERTDTIDFEQPLDAFIDSIHSRNGFSRARMSEGAAGGLRRRGGSADPPPRPGRRRAAQGLQHGQMELRRLVTERASRSY